MAEPREPPNYEDAIQAFLSWVEQVQIVEVIDPDTQILRPFVAAEDMRNHFEQYDYRRLKKVIAAHPFPSSGSLWPDDIIPDNVAVFCTLLSVSKGWWMKQFCHHGDLSDRALPFNPERPPQNWPVGADFLPKFCEAQWKFCAQVLRAPFINKRFAKDMVLPIIFKETLNTEGSSASLWLVRIHPSYNKLISETEKQRLGPLANTFVMKTYFTTEAESYYDTEVAAFRHLGFTPSIIRFHGSFTRGDSYNVLLEYADKGTLGDYFKTESPPSEGEDTIGFWETMFELIDALRAIHEVGSDASDGPGVFQGRHQDVKPENVLIVSNGSEDRREWKFKLADLGISNFKGKKAGGHDTADKNARGTRTYGAPESYRPDATHVHDTVVEGQNSDIWSLGCIFSEAARWLKDGHRGIQTYRQERQAETNQIHGFRDGDCFHDGEKILTCVRQCHKYSVRNLRPEDCITKPVVDSLISDMMGKAQARSTAFRLYQKSRQLIADAKIDLEAVRAESHFQGRPRNRSVTVPTSNSRPPPPPNLPPGYPPMNNLHAVQPNMEMFTSPYSFPHNNSPPQILDPVDATSEPGSLPLSPISLTKPNSSGETSYQQSPPGIPTITHNEPEDMDPLSNPKYGSGKTWRPAAHEASASGTVASEPQHSPPISNVARHESPSPPLAQSAIPMTPSSSQPVATPDSSSPQRAPSARHSAQQGISHRPKPLILQRPPKLPYLSLEEALEWRRKRKGNGPRRPLKDAQYLDRLKERDHVFLIDDSASMNQHWGNVQNVFETLSYIVKEVDPNGFDLWFTGPGKPLKNQKRTTEALQTVEIRRPRGTTDINNKLEKIFEDYIEALRKPKTGMRAMLSRAVKPLSLYVLTDGVWEDNCNPRHLVETFVKQLEDLGKVKGKVGIQFVSFGEDMIGLERMELLDSGLNVKLDIVDTEPRHGNVWKMLLGAINDSFDKIHDKHEADENGSSFSNRMSMRADSKEEYS